jgi:hypothetical protein
LMIEASQFNFIGKCRKFGSMFPRWPGATLKNT